MQSTCTTHIEEGLAAICFLPHFAYYYLYYLVYHFVMCIYIYTYDDDTYIHIYIYIDNEFCLGKFCCYHFVEGNVSFIFISTTYSVTHRYSADLIVVVIIIIIVGLGNNLTKTIYTKRLVQVPVPRWFV